MEPRVPSLRSARLAVLAVLAAVSGARAHAPSPGPTLAWVRDAEGCHLDRTTTGAACPCQALPTRARRLRGLPLPLNRARAMDLLELPGVGAARARAIVTERERHGPFSSRDALRRVPGIGRELASRLKPWLFVGDRDPACD